MDMIKVAAILWVALALGLALLISKLMKKIHFPNVTGYLIGGILIGPWVIGLFNQSLFNDILKEVSWVSEIALGFIAFTIGGSFKISALKSVGKKATIISVFEALGGAIFVVLFLFIAYFAGMKNLGLTIPIILILGSIACATAPAATLLVINQYKAKGPVTSTLIPVVAFDDAVALICFSIMFSIAKVIQVGGEFNFVEGILAPILEIVISLILGAALGFLIGFATKWFKSRHNRLILVIFAILLLVGLAQIKWGEVLNLGISFNLSSLLMVMALGGVFANVGRGNDITNEYLDKFTAPIFTLFFVISGANLNFGIFSGNQVGLVLAIAGIYIVSRAIGKWSGAALGSNVTKCEPTVKKYLGFTLIPQAGVALGLAANAQKYMQGIGHAELGTLIYTIIIVSTIVYELTGPLITKWALTKAGEITCEAKTPTQKQS